jgi:hypothetical protein
MRLKLLAAAVAASPLFLLPSAGAQTFYDYRYQLEAVASNLTDYTFDGMAGTDNRLYNPDLSPLTVSVTGGSDTNYYVQDSTYGAYNYSIGTDTLAAGIAELSQPTVTIGLGGSYTAFGTLMYLPQPFMQLYENNVISVSLFNGANQVGQTYTSDPFRLRFMGFTTETPFDSVRFTAHELNGANLIFDNIMVGAAGVAAEPPGGSESPAVPEPGTWALLAGTGAIGGLIALRRRK